ncbi:hypothetical protein [Saccharothrix yanglingensis]|uniref:Uncharacterized protein n=1 Tax=Saccharothrix yanglingensis TaxID=659496 RepID=A0ABU0X1S5_9PSEU|nr:hypothetical protein [Saccharothrix yanglingensis]MDQ2586076.1 hypothetical protein [Saccharothrix yanglingensis]
MSRDVVTAGSTPAEPQANADVPADAVADGASVGFIAAGAAGERGRQPSGSTGARTGSRSAQSRTAG